MDTYQIIAVDFDGTLCYSDWPALGEPNTPLIDFLKVWRAQGNKLILWTCRAGEALDSAVSWCSEQNLEFDAVNDNLPEIVEKYGNNSRKITCDYYIDDRACPFFPTLECAVWELREETGISTPSLRSAIPKQKAAAIARHH